MQIVHSDVRFQHRRTVFRLEPQQPLRILYIPQLCIAVILQLVCLRIQRDGIILSIVRQIKGIRIFYRFIPLFIIKPRISLLIAVRHAALSCQSDICERVIHLRVRAEVHTRKFKFFRSTQSCVPQNFPQIAIEYAQIVFVRAEQYNPLRPCIEHRV